MKANIYELKENLTTVDLEVLHSIYLFRCLTVKQVYKNFYEKIIPTFSKFLDTKLNDLVKWDLLEEVIFNKDNIALFLTTSGVNLVKEVFNLPLEVFDNKTKTIKRGVYRAYELKMLPRLIPHQIYLNQFALDFKNIYKHRAITDKLEYFDEKYVSQYLSIRPDGLIRLPKVDFFLEMDMNTESKVQLEDKWKHYRSFLTSNEYLKKRNNIVVLFIIENTTNIQNRKNIVKSTASKILLDVFDENFDIIVGTKEELLKKVFNILIPDLYGENIRAKHIKELLSKKHGFDFANGLDLKDKLNNAKYRYYIRKLDKNKQLIVEGNKIQEYLLDYYYGDNLSIPNKIAYLAVNSSTFKRYFQRDISYILVVDDLTKIYDDLSLYELESSNNVYFTTIERLNNLPFCKALCQFDSLGRIYSFTDNNLHMRYYQD